LRWSLPSALLPLLGDGWQGERVLAANGERTRGRGIALKQARHQL
jgi:hypothetical protein